MKTKFVPRFFLVAVSMCVLLVLTACTPNVEGNYADPDGVMKVELKSGGEARVSMFTGQGGPCTYDVKDKKVLLHCNGSTTAFSIRDDGSLGAPAGGFIADLKKMK